MRCWANSNVTVGITGLAPLAGTVLARISRRGLPGALPLDVNRRLPIDSAHGRHSRLDALVHWGASRDSVDEGYRPRGTG